MNRMNVECINLGGAISVFAKKDGGGQRKPCHWSQCPVVDSEQSPTKYKLETLLLPACSVFHNIILLPMWRK